MSSPRVVVLDHGSGNVHSAVRALSHVGAQVELTADRAAVLGADIGAVSRCRPVAEVTAAAVTSKSAAAVASRSAGANPVKSGSDSWVSSARWG